ncbi:TPA: DNA adenine methylase [Stenotrophomonas maltophilia]
MKTTTLFPWPGGKTRLLPHLLPLVAENQHRTYVEAFAGGAALLFAREPARAEVLNDCHGELVRLYRVVANHLEEFVRQFKWALTSREMFRWCQLQHPDTLTDIQRAARFYYLQRLAWGGKATGQTPGFGRGGKGLNLLRIEEDLSAAHLRLHKVTVEHLAWQQCMAKYDATDTLFFLDPPYWETEGYGAPFGMEQYEQLASQMAALRGAAILTINDHPTMRKVFGQFRDRVVPIRYTIGRQAVQRRELIYTTW